MIQYFGLWVLLALTLNMWGLLSVLASDARIVVKAIWAMLLVLLPGLGFVTWYLIGPRRKVA